MSRGRLLALSTPFGKRGLFWREWHDAQGPWARFRIPWQHCPRLNDEFIAEERRKFGDSWIKQEYECCFEAMEGLVYPGFEQCVTTSALPPTGQLVGGIDWGMTPSQPAIE